ncbi:MAG TPA: hypothetical protein G4O00_05865 [Thermoflexia bacterium]|nr:hypothetical protein [Thermoflexia bacterium]
MKHSLRILGLAVLIGCGALVLLIVFLPNQSAPSLAAPPPRSEAVGRLSPQSLLITCTLASTTTDALPGINSFDDAAILADYEDLALVTGNKGDERNPEEDYFRLDNAVPNWTYYVEAVPDGVGNYNLGIVVYNASRQAILTDANTLDGNDASVSLVATDSGPYFFKVFQISNYCSGGTYHLTAYANPPTPTPTSTPGPTPTSTPPAPTPIPGADRFEPNYDFDHAATLAIDITYTDLNFVPWGDAAEDNDFYKIWVKPGLLYTCETLDLGPGVDTNIIVYDANRNPIGGNDDVELGDYRSRFSYFSNYEGYLYILVGHGGRLPLAEVENSSYSFRCSVTVPGQPTATPTPRPTRTPRPVSTPTPPISPVATPTLPPGALLDIRLLSTPTPPPPPPSRTPTPHFVPVDLLVYYDANDDHSPDPGEGVSGIPVLAYDTSTGAEVAQCFTELSGRCQFTVAVQGQVRISIPYLGIDYVIGEEGATLHVRIPPGPLP